MYRTTRSHGRDLCLYGFRRRIVASVHQAAVGLRRAQRNIVSRLDYANGQVKPRELPRDGAPGNARAHNCDIKRFCHSAPRQVDRLSIGLSYGLYIPSAAAMRRTAPQHPPTAGEGRLRTIGDLVCVPGVRGLSRSVTVSRRTGFQMLQIETFARRVLRLS